MFQITLLCQKFFTFLPIDVGNIYPGSVLVVACSCTYLVGIKFFECYWIIFSKGEVICYGIISSYLSIDDERIYLGSVFIVACS